MVTECTFTDLRMTQTSRKIKGTRECGKLDKTGSTDGTLASGRRCQHKQLRGRYLAEEGDQPVAEKILPVTLTSGQGDNSMVCAKTAFNCLRPISISADHMSYCWCPQTLFSTCLFARIFLEFFKLNKQVYSCQIIR